VKALEAIVTRVADDPSLEEASVADFFLRERRQDDGGKKKCINASLEELRDVIVRKRDLDPNSLRKDWLKCSSLDGLAPMSKRIYGKEMFGYLSRAYQLTAKSDDEAVCSRPMDERQDLILKQVLQKTRYEKALKEPMLAKIESGTHELLFRVVRSRKRNRSGPSLDAIRENQEIENEEDKVMDSIVDGSQCES